MLIQLYLLTTNFFSKVTVPIYTSCGLWLLTVSSYSLETNLWEFFWPGVNAAKFQRGIYDCFCQLPRDTINSRLFEKKLRSWVFILRRHRQIRLQTGIIRGNPCGSKCSGETSFTFHPMTNWDRQAFPILFCVVGLFPVQPYIGSHILWGSA